MQDSGETRALPFLHPNPALLTDPMKCPFCKHPDTQVVDSRESEEGDSIRRRRRCLSCDKRFTTYETVELRMPQVVKQNGMRSEFDAEKLRTSFCARAAQAPGADRAGGCGDRPRHAKSLRPGRARDRLAPDRRDGDEGVAEAGQGRLYPLCLGVQKLSGCRRFCRCGGCGAQVPGASRSHRQKPRLRQGASRC